MTAPREHLPSAPLGQALPEQDQSLLSLPVGQLATFTSMSSGSAGSLSVLLA